MSTIYTRLGHDDEWLIGVQPSDRITRFHFAIIRDGIILLQGDFDMLPGEDLGERMHSAFKDWKHRPRSWHALFHKACRGLKPELPLGCNGKCPWMCARVDLKKTAETWSWIVPPVQRRQGNNVFRAWAEPPKTIEAHA
jgi:hypothetical protein